MSATRILWGQMLLVLLVAFLFIWAATQWTAWCPGFQAQLGPPIGDPQGYAGLEDRVDYHWGRVAKAAILSTVLGIGAELGISSSNDIARAIREGTQGTLNQAGQQIISRQLDVPPTITIRPGTPVRVMVTRDLILDEEGD
jgi:type IV secretory pathway VirB10-like protein